MISTRAIRRTSDDFREASFDVELGVEPKSVGLVLVRHVLKQLDENEIFVGKILKVNFQPFLFCFCQLFFLSKTVQIYLGQQIKFQKSF